MSNHIRLFERPLVADETLPPLRVTGILPEYTPEAAYEGRLDILNSVGKCTVEVLESTLPPGAFVRVDNITKEVVVKWAAYTREEETISSVPGGDFEDGGNSGWLLGNGWSVGTGPDYDVKSGAYSARFAGVKTKGSDIISPRFPAKVNDYIRVTTQVQQGASAEGNAGARVSLIYRNETGGELLRLWGNLVTSGSGGAWKESVAEGAAPADTATVEVVVSAYRNRENFALWVDDVVWTHKYTVGQDNDDLYFLRLRVRDSLNREAYWQGYIEEAANVWISQLYPTHHREFLSLAATKPAGFEVAEAPDVVSLVLSTVSAPTVTVFALRNVTLAMSHAESAQMAAPAATQFALREVIRRAGADDERSHVAAPNAVLFRVRPEPVFTYTTQGVVNAPTATRFTIT